MSKDDQILAAVKRLLEEKPENFGDAFDTLQQSFDNIPPGDKEATRQAANQALDILDKFPKAKKRFLKQVEENEIEVLDETRFIYERPPGGPEVISASMVMICSDDTCPNKRERKLRQKGQILLCPDCGKPLVPKTRHQTY